MARPAEGLDMTLTRNLLTMALLALAVLLASCGSERKAAEKGATDQNAPRTFASPAEAGLAIFEAAKAGDQTTLLAIFGPEAKDLLFSGDAVQDKNTRENFVAAYTR